jgi:pimeloyl-ACP methyl ester carboxylesterase
MVDIDGNKCEDDCRFSGQATAVSLTEFMAGGFAKLQEAIFETGREDPAHRGYYVSLRLCDPRLYHANSRELVELSRREDLAARLAALPMPTLYIAGVPFGASARSLQLLDDAGARRVTIEPSGHWPFIDQTDRFVAEFDRFLRS